jgi:hypothetical protein
MKGAAQKKQQQQAEAQQAKEQTAACNQKMDTYKRACAACLEGKGYTVK